MEDETGTRLGPRRPFLRLLFMAGKILGAVAATATIVVGVFEVAERVAPQPAPAVSESFTASSPATPTTSGLRANGDERLIQVADCVRNVADPESPVYELATCGPGTQQVVARLEQVIDDENQADALCAKEAPTFADYHYSNWAKRSDYINVLFCLR
ncbi:hypothetical protein HCA58_16785 [Micromonospora sp. HNM0581]|uniref:hypothetical protein n=1 Tax=Micromonospora sp. HNM0581 TaxID=2716341 RepID=UPI00146F3B77|nr:hypothetical protein [Micromonospora sp. HNM0581]NLU80012.1 hypothetical protein [Micromonospora sp. HNM0581]